MKLSHCQPGFWPIGSRFAQVRTTEPSAPAGPVNSVESLALNKIYSFSGGVVGVMIYP